MNYLELKTSCIKSQMRVTLNEKMSRLKFDRRCQDGLTVFVSPQTSMISAVYNPATGKIFPRILSNDSWEYPLWIGKGFDSSDDLEDYLNLHDWEHANVHDLPEYTDDQLFACVYMAPTSDRDKYNIEAGISSRELMRNLVRVKSSNMWGMAIDIKNSGDQYGDVIVQFKGKHGGPDDVYQYFDVPIKVYRKWVNAPSKGHFFWENIRDVYQYRKLTGDKRGKLKNAIN